MAGSPAVPVDSITEDGRYVFIFGDPSAVQSATQSHPGWAATLSDAIAAQTGWDTKVVASGAFSEVVNGTKEGRFGVILDATSPSSQPTTGIDSGGVVLEPAQFMVGVGLATIGVGIVVSAIVAALELPKMELTFIEALHIFSGSKGPWDNIGRAALWGTIALVLFGAAAVVGAFVKFRRRA